MEGGEKDSYNPKVYFPSPPHGSSWKYSLLIPDPTQNTQGQHTPILLIAWVV